LSKGKKASVIARRWARIANTDDGKAVIEDLKKQINWDEAGPASAADEHPLHFWIGQRSAIKYILENISTGKDLSENNETDE